ncbi:MAG TPA: hypothetical protein VIT92_01360, partial [Burkholderiaceae bacterium]
NSLDAVVRTTTPKLAAALRKQISRLQEQLSSRPAETVATQAPAASLPRRFNWSTRPWQK